MPDLLVIIIHLKNPVLVHGSVLLKQTDQHTLFFHFLASSRQQLFKSNTPIQIESKFNGNFYPDIDLEILRKHKEQNYLVMTSMKICPRFV